MQDANDTALGCGAAVGHVRHERSQSTPHVPDVGPKCGIGGSVEASAAGEEL